jgi:hypothetical protein
MQKKSIFVIILIVVVLAGYFVAKNTKQRAEQYQETQGEQVPQEQPLQGEPSESIEEYPIDANKQENAYPINNTTDAPQPATEVSAEGVQTPAVAQ